MTFGPTLITVKNQLISADFNQPISDFPSDLVILDQNYNMGHFSHSILVTEPNSAVGIEKFQKLWNFSEFLESAHTYLKLGCFWQLRHYSHSILSTQFDFDIRIEKFETLQKNLSHIVHTYMVDSNWNSFSQRWHGKNLSLFFTFAIINMFYYIKCTYIYKVQVTIWTEKNV